MLRQRMEDGVECSETDCPKNIEEEELLENEESINRNSIEEEIELIGNGYFHKRTVIILGIGNVSDAVEILAIGYLMTVYEQEEGKLTPMQSSFLTAAVFCGMLLGGFAGGVLSDQFGRRPLLLLHLTINAMSAVCAALSPSVYWLIFFRIIAGYGVGGTVSSLFALCVEHMPSSVRGFYVTILCSFWMVGSILTAGIAWIMLGEYVGGGRIMNISWRWFAAFVSLPSFGCLWLSYLFIPESARYLVSKGRIKEAETVLSYIHKVHQSNRKSYLELNEVIDDEQHIKSDIMSIQRSNIDESKERDWIVRLKVLFRGSLLRPTILLLLISYCQSFGSYGLATWITKLFKGVGLSNPYANAFLYAGANLPGNLLSAYFIDHIGRKKLLSGSMISAATACLLFGLNTNGTATYIVLAACAFNASATSAWNAFGVVSAEAFPTTVRATGMSIINCMGRIGAISAQFVNAYLFGENPNVALLLFITSMAMTCGAIAAMMLPHEVHKISTPIHI